MILSDLLFPPFRLDVVNNRLWREAYEIPLRPKAFAVLRLLVERHGAVVSREDLFRTVWPNTVVSEGVLKVCIREIREALGDNSLHPRFIETLPKQGYRFIASFGDASQVKSQKSKVESQKPYPIPNPQHPAPNLVGRETELAQLQVWLNKAANGERQIVFVTGEPGIGKTAVVDAFVAQVRSMPQVRVAHGQCVAHYGAGEAYLPILDAFEQACRTPAREQIVTLLSQYAPLWLSQLPAILPPAERERLQRELQGVTQERMLREMATFLEALTFETPLVVVLEDLHWSDVSTLTLLSAVARRRSLARLLVIGTYRLTDIRSAHHPLAAVIQELRLHRQCEDLPLSLLSEADVASYLTARVAGHPTPEGFAHAIYQQTEGNPLFMVNLVDHVLAQSGGPSRLSPQPSFETALRSLPESLWQMLTYQIDRLGKEEQQTLEAASVAGMEFSAAAVAAALNLDVLSVEQTCGLLAQRHRLLHSLPSAAGPEERRASRYKFQHSLFHKGFYDRLGVAQRRHLHQRVGEQKEFVYGDRAGEIAAELALHFIEGDDAPRAVRYLQQAARTALQRSAHQEARTHLTQAFDWVQRLQPTEQTQKELDLLLMLGVTLMSLEGFASSRVEQTYARARALCQQLGPTPQLFPALWGLRSFYHVRAQHHTARELAEQFLQLAQTANNPELLLEGHLALGVALLFLGEVKLAQAHLEQSLQQYDPQQHATHAYLYGQDPGVLAWCHLGMAFIGMGCFDQAAASTQRAVTLAEQIAHPFSLAYALNFAAAVHQGRQEAAPVIEQAERALSVAQTYSFPHFLVMGTLLRGWGVAALGRQEEGLQLLQQGIDGQRRIGFELGRSYYLALLAEVHGQMEHSEAGLRVIDEALLGIQKTGERFYETELYRLKGELTLQKTGVRGWGLGTSSAPLRAPSPKSQAPSGVEQEAEGYFHKAIAVARQQGTKLTELRASLSLSLLWRQQGKRAQARQLLVGVYEQFTEGFALTDLQQARAWIEELA